MNKNYKKLLAILVWSPIVNATPISDYGFKSPSFSGSGYSSHVLTIENQEFTRRQQVAKDIQAALDRIKADAVLLASALILSKAACMSLATC